MRKLDRVTFNRTKDGFSIYIKTSDKTAIFLTIPNKDLNRLIQMLQDLKN